MRRVLVLASASVLLLAGCGERQASPEPLPPGQLAPADLSPAERQAFVYAAAIRHVVEELPEKPKAIFVLHRAEGDGAPIARDVQDRVREELALLGNIRFVGSADTPRGKRDSVVITLGPVPSDPDRVEIEASVKSGDAPRGPVTLVLKREGLRWDVTASRDGAA